MSRGAQDRRKDAIEYLHSMLGQLHHMAEAHELDMLSYLIEMAYVEASDTLQRETASSSAKQDDDQAA